VFPWSLFATLTLTNYLFKVAVEACMTPLTYLAVNGLKRAEAEDFFDRGTILTAFADIVPLLSAATVMPEDTANRMEVTERGGTQPARASPPG